MPDTTSFLSAAASALFDDLEALRAKIEARDADLGFFAKYDYQRDKLGRLERRTLFELGGVAEYGYEYDITGRLIAETVNGVRTAWTYDANSNRTHENGLPIATYDAEDRLLTWKGNSYTYSAAGELASKTNGTGTTAYHYDGLGNLRAVDLPDGGRIEYLIDPQNRRIGKRKDGALQYGLLYRDQLNPIASLKPDGTIESVFVYAEYSHVPSAMLKGDKLYRFVVDHLGSVRIVIDADTGQVAQRIGYDAWGRVLFDSNPGFQPFGFAGGLYDSETGLTRFGVRDYDAETGRWAAKDSIQFAGGGCQSIWLRATRSNHIVRSQWAEDPCTPPSFDSSEHGFQQRI